MFKTIQLIKANLKRFIRDWKAISLLIVFPLILIGVVFVSFNPSGLRKVPVGIISVSEQGSEVGIQDYEHHLSYLNLKRFSTLNECLNDLKRYNSYVCIEIEELTYKDEGVMLKVHYDNTREPIIWEIIERIKSTIEYFQKQISKEMATDFITVLDNTGNRIDDFKINLRSTHGKIDDYIDETDKSEKRLSSAKKDVEYSLDNMDRDLSDIEYTNNRIKNEKERLHSESFSRLYKPDASVDEIILRNQIEYFNDRSGNMFAEVDEKIKRYKELSKQGRSHISEIDLGLVKLRQVKRDLDYYKSRLKETDNELGSIQQNFKSFRNLDPETFVNPIVINNYPVFVPNQKNKEKEVIETFNLMSLKTIFPMILLLITLFISLLISSFMCLKDINSPANKRIRLIKGVFFPEVFAVYISSLIIILVPILCVLALGDFVFKIAIFYHINTVALIMFLLISSFILIGMLLAYLVKKESVTLLVTTFLLVFFIFISGFLLPIERMSHYAAIIANHFPGKIALSAFNKVVFYNASLKTINNDIISLIVWIVFILSFVILFKWLRND